jgi:hypothetical protein
MFQLFKRLSDSYEYFSAAIYATNNINGIYRSQKKKFSFFMKINNTT